MAFELLTWEQQEALQGALQNAFDAHIKERIVEYLDKYQHLVDETVKARLTGNYTPEVNKEYFNRIQETVYTYVGNYLRCNELVISQLIHKAIDAQLEQTIAANVKQRLEQVVKRITEAAKLP